MENYIEDILDQLIEEAHTLKEIANSEFEIGELHGYYRTISIILNQAESFGISDKLPPKHRDYNPEGLIAKNK